MKKLLVLTVLFTSFTALATTEKTFMFDYLPYGDIEDVFEIKTYKFEKVILDCQSVNKGLFFYKNSKIAYSFFIDSSYDCLDLQDYLQSSKNSEANVCFEITNSALSITDAPVEDCI